MSKIELTEEQRTHLQKLELEMLEELDRICTKHGIKYTLIYGTLIGAIRHNGFIPWDDDIDVGIFRNDLLKFREICKTELGEKFFFQTNDTDPEYFHLVDKLRMNDTIFKETYFAKHNIHHGVYIDIFPIDKVPDSPIKSKFQYYLFHFYRTGLMAKYLDLNARHGAKRVFFTIMRILYAPISIKTLYDGANRTASRYDNVECARATIFPSAYHSKDVSSIDTYTQVIRAPFEGKEFMLTKHYDSLLKKIYGDYMQLPPVDKRTTRHDLEKLEI